MPLSDTSLRNLKPQTSPYKKFDSNGLFVQVMPNGSKLWRCNVTVLGKRKTVALGQYPDVPLADARKKRDDARQLAAKDLDPVKERREIREEAIASATNTFGAVAADFLAKLEKEGREAPTITKNTWLLTKVVGGLGKMPVKEIRPRDVLRVLKAVEDTGRVNTAIEARAAIGRVFRFAIASELCDTDPTYALRGALLTHTPDSHPALTDPKAVGGLVRSIKEYDAGHYTTKALLLAQMYCFTRPSETRTMMWSELDLDRKVWTVPAEKAKMRRLLDVPLTTQMLALIESMRPWTGHTDVVFGSIMSGKKFQSENTMNSTLRRMGFSKEEHTAHGFRSTASTILNESKLFRGEVIEAQLAHKDKDAVRAIYNRAEYWDERVPMMQWYADHLDSLGATR